MNETEKAVLAPAPARRQGIVAKLAATYDMDADEFGKTLVATVFPNGKGSITQVAALCMVADEFRLNPLTKQIYAFPQGKGIIPIISVDGWYAIANRQLQFDGIEFEYIDDEAGKPVACTATVHRKDRAHPVKVTEYVSECKRNTPPWNNQTRRMIRHRAAIQGIRIAFGISAIDPEEAERIPEYEVEAGREPVAAVAAINERLAATPSQVPAEVVDTLTGEVTPEVDTTIANPEHPPTEVPLQEPEGNLWAEEEEKSAFEL